MQKNNTKAPDTAVKAMRELFWTRLEGLLIEQGQIKREEQWTYLDVAKTTLNNWKNALALPGHVELVRIAHKLGCSVDYLIDETVTVRTAAADTQAAVKTTGLSESAVQVLQNCQSCGAVEILNTVSALVVTDITPVQVEEGNLTIPARQLTHFTGTGTGVQESGLIAALHRNFEADLKYEAEKARLAGMSKADTTPEELEEWFEQKRKINSAKTSLDNSGYHMMLTCTTATAEGQQYHEALKAEYQKGGSDNGSGNE